METSRVGPVGTIWEGRSPVDGDMRGKLVEVHDYTGRRVDGGVCIATGGFPAGSGPHIKLGDRIAVVVAP